MPPRRRAAAAAPATTPPLDGLTIAVSGKFDDIGHSHSSLESLVVSLGGAFSRSVTAKTTHVICTEYDFKAGSSKINTAKTKGLKIVSPEWLIEAEKSKTKPNEDDYSWEAKKTPPAAAPKKNGTTKAASTATGKKRGAAAAAADTDDNNDADADDEPKTKKAKASTKSTRGKGKAAKAAVKDESEPEPEPEPETKEEKVVAEGQFIKKKDVAIPVDDYCYLTGYIVFVDPDSGMIYDASLNQSNSSNNNNKFYRIQILLEPQSKSYKTWTRWGRVGEAGQKAVLGNGTLPDAIKNFEKKFKDKSGLTWDNRGENPKPGKYAFVERSYNPDSDDEDDEDVKAVKKEGEEEAAPPECTLEKPVKELMELIFNQQYFQATMSALNYDAQKLPLGKLSKATITRGFQQLKDLAALMDDHTLAASKWDMSYAAATEHLSNTYYSVIPHAFGRNRPPIIRDDNMLKKEVELLESLSDMKDAAEIMKIDRKTRDTVHPLDRQFQGLGLNEMSVVDSTSNEFNLLEKYLNDSRGATHHVNYEVQQIFRIEREGETKRFDESEYSKIKSDRRLLWHGSRCTNFGGILSQGLRIAPPEAPVSGYMFGKGIYLADMSSKSAGYCASYISNGHALLLLCEAELGDPMQKLIHANYNAGTDAKSGGMYSTWGQGDTGPSKWMDAGVVHEGLKGIKMPDTNSKPGPTNVKGAGLRYNEYIVYDVAQVKMRYLLRVKM